VAARWVDTSVDRLFPFLKKPLAMLFIEFFWDHTVYQYQYKKLAVKWVIRKIE
jgi:hypothetical protein